MEQNNFAEEIGSYRIPEQKQKSPELNHLRDAIDAFHYGIDSSLSFFDFYIKSKKGRQGQDSNAEQDLLRGIIIFSSATLDIAIKYCLRKTIPLKRKQDCKVNKKFQDYVQRILTKDEKRQILSEIIVSDSPVDNMMEKYITDLTGSSMQSASEYIKACEMLNIEQIDKEKMKILDEAFKERNKIVHEADFNPQTSRGKRNRIQRNAKKCCQYAKTLLETTQQFIFECKIAI